MDVKRIVEELPPTEKLYLDDSYLREAEGTILKVVREKGRRYYLVLDRTIFHPLSGGQPSDTGEVRGDFRFEVKKALKVGDYVVLYGKAVEGFPEEGAKVKQVLNWERRYLIMRLHTAGHLLDRAVSDTIGAQVHTLGAMHGPPKAYVEYDRLEVDLSHLEKRANELIDDREVIIKYVTPEELPKAIYGAPNLGRIPEASIYRVVELVGINAIPCTGTHVKRTSEIGRIVLRDVEKVERGFRLYYLVEG